MANDATSPAPPPALVGAVALFTGAAVGTFTTSIIIGAAMLAPTYPFVARNWTLGIMILVLGVLGICSFVGVIGVTRRHQHKRARAMALALALATAQTDPPSTLDVMPSDSPLPPPLPHPSPPADPELGVVVPLDAPAAPLKEEERPEAATATVAAPAAPSAPAAPAAAPASTSLESFEVPLAESSPSSSC